MLILFDIDGTLLLSRGAGMRCMEAAGQELFARPFPANGIDFGGGLDPDIFRRLCAQHGVDDAARHEPAFRATYARRLAASLAPGDAYALPGVEALVSALEAREGVALGLLTGNYPETGCLKLASAGLAIERFGVNAWGDDAPTRPGLLPVALRRYAVRHGRRLPPERVVIIGDTPRDVEVALAHGARSLAVATGRHGVEALTSAGAHLAVADLADTGRLLEWLST